MGPREPGALLPGDLGYPSAPLEGADPGPALKPRTPHMDARAAPRRTRGPDEHRPWASSDAHRVPHNLSAMSPVVPRDREQPGRVEVSELAGSVIPGQYADRSLLGTGA